MVLGRLLGGLLKFVLVLRLSLVFIGYFRFYYLLHFERSGYG